MAETLFAELKRYVGFQAEDEAALRKFYPVASPQFVRIADLFYRRILDHERGTQGVGRREPGRPAESYARRMDAKTAYWAVG